MGDPLVLRKEGYAVLVKEEVETGVDEWTLWYGEPVMGELIGRWKKPSMTPDGFVDEVEEIRLNHKARRSEHNDDSNQ